MEKWKTKAIQADSGTFRHIQAYLDISRCNQAYSGIIQAYSEPCVTLAYSELWQIENPGIFKTRGKFKTLIYTKRWFIEPWAIQKRRHDRNLVKHLQWSTSRNSKQL